MPRMQSYVSHISRVFCPARRAPRILLPRLLSLISHRHGVYRAHDICFTHVRLGAHLRDAVINRGIRVDPFEIDNAYLIDRHGSAGYIFSPITILLRFSRYISFPGELRLVIYAMGDLGLR